MQKEPLLFLCHRIPFPPNKGDKIRSFNMLKVLSRHYDIFLASFVDDPFDWQYADKLDEYCIDKILLNQNKLLAKIKGTTAFVTGKAISIPYYYDRQLAAWVDETVKAKRICKVFVYSSVMAQFLDNFSADQITSIVDFVDVDSDKWRQYAEGKTGVAKWIYQREFKKLRSFENMVAKDARHSLFVSPQEAALFKEQVSSEIGDKVSGMLNGVDTVFFDPDFVSDMADVPDVDVVFTGAMDYWANVDAVNWFMKHVWSLIRKDFPNANFYIVGGNPSSEIQAYHERDGVVVTGRVKDVRPYIHAAKVSVAPLQIARGIQNKVLEAMSMAKPVVATSMADEGIESKTENVVVLDDPEHFAKAVCDYLDRQVKADENRTWIQQNLQWNATLDRLPKLFVSE